MKILLEDKSYYQGTKIFEMMDDYMGGDFAMMIEYLQSYCDLLEYKSQFAGGEEYAHLIIWQAKIKEIKRLTEKYKKLIEFIQYVDGEEHAL